MGRLPTPTLTLVTGGRHMVTLDALHFESEAGLRIHACPLFCFVFY